MSDALWYYAQGDKEQGPVTLAQIKALIQAGKIKPDDLVWREGLEDWLAAGKAPGLFSSEPAVADAPPSPATSSAAVAPAASAATSAARGKTIAETPPRIEVPTRPPGAPMPAPTPPPAASETMPPPPVEGPRGGAQRGAARTGSAFGGGLPALPFSLSPAGIARALGRPLLIVGLFLVLLNRGCDAIGQRYVQRVKALADSTEARFQDEWDSEKNTLVTRLQTIRDKKEKTKKDEDALVELDDKLTKLNERKREQADLNRTGAWAALSAKARSADADYRLAGYWREVWFVFGTLILTVGLLATGLTGEGPEKWIAFIILAILVFSLYVGGAAWGGGFASR